MTDVVNVGTFANDPSADPLRSAFQKVNAKFQALDAGGVGSGAVLLTDLGDGLAAWQAAAALVAAGEIGEIVIPTKKDDQVSIARAALSDPLAGLITFTQNLRLRFEGPVTLEFDYIGTPLFCFSGLTAGGVVGHPRYRFTGTVPASAAITRASYCAASGFPFGAMVGGGDYELWSIILSNSSGLYFDECELDSATPGSEQHCTPFLYNLKPPTEGTYATGNVVAGGVWRDFMYGLLYIEQKDYVIGDINADRRCGFTNGGIGPGHVTYASGLGTGHPNIGGACGVVTDGPNPINWPASAAQQGGTCSIKDFQYSAHAGIKSFHPSGPLSAGQLIKHNTLGRIGWVTEDNTALAAAINLFLDNTDNIWEGIHVRAPNKVFLFVTNASGVFDRNSFGPVYVYASFDLGAGAPQGVFDFGGSENDIPNVTLRPSGPVSGTCASAVQQRLNVGTGNYVAGVITGAYPDTRITSCTDNGADGNYVFSTQKAGVNNDNYSWINQGLETPSGTFVQTQPWAARYAQDDAGGTGAAAVVFNLPGRGNYDLFIDVRNGDGTSKQYGRFSCTYGDNGASVTDVQTVGAIRTVGAQLSALAVTVSNTGAVTVSYTKGASFYARVSFNALLIGATFTV